MSSKETKGSGSQTEQGDAQTVGRDVVSVASAGEAGRERDTNASAGTASELSNGLVPERETDPPQPAPPSKKKSDPSGSTPAFSSGDQQQPVRQTQHQQVRQQQEHHTQKEGLPQRQTTPPPPQSQQQTQQPQQPPGQSPNRGVLPTLSTQTNVPPQKPAAPEGSTVVGMVGTTPIVRLSDKTRRQVVKQKKGRFTLLQDAPANPAESFGLEPTASAETKSPRSFHERKLSTASVNSSVSNPKPVPNEPQTFEGTGAPVVRKKGRFFVTNLKDPTLISVNVNPHPQIVSPNPVPQVVPVQTILAVPAATNQLEQQAPHQASQHLAQPVLQTVMLADGQPHHPSMPQLELYAPLSASQSVNSAPTGWSEHIPVTTGPQQAVSTSSLQPAPTAAVPVVDAAVMSSSSVLPIQQVAITATTPDEEPVRKAPQPTRSHLRRGGTKGIAGQNGLGKVFYFLDQMRLEVTEADKTIKSLQSDTKFLVCGL